MSGTTQSRRLSTRLWIFATEGMKLFAIAAGCLVVFAIAFFISVRTGLVRIHIPARWFGLFYWTYALLWFVFQQHKRDLRLGRFWLALSAFLMLHVTTFAVVLRAYPAWPMIWFMFIFVIEGPLVLVVLKNVVHV
jgi:hypothetical protein